MVGPSGRAVVLALAAGLAATACRPAQALREIHTVASLQQRFDDDAGSARVVLLLSPT